MDQNDNRYIEYTFVYIAVYVYLFLFEYELFNCI